MSKTMQAILEDTVVDDIAARLNDRHNYKYTTLWCMGIQLGVTPGTLLDIKYSDMSGNMLKTVHKTHRTDHKLSDDLMLMVSRLKELNPGDKYLFQGTLGIPYDRSTINKILRDTGKALGVKISMLSMVRTHEYRVTRELAKRMPKVDQDTPMRTKPVTPTAIYDNGSIRIEVKDGNSDLMSALMATMNNHYLHTAR